MKKETMKDVVVLEIKKKKLTKTQIEKFAVGHPYPTDVVEKVLEHTNWNQKKASRILIDRNKTLDVWQGK